MSPKAASLILAGIAITGAALLTFLVVYALWTGGVPTRTGSIYKNEDPAAYWSYISVLQIIAFCCLWVSIRFK